MRRISSSKNRPVSGLRLVCCISAVGMLWLGMAVAVRADEPKAKAAAITAEEAQQFVEAIDKAVAEGDLKACIELVDWDAILDTATAEPKSPKVEKVRSGFKGGALKRLAVTGGLLGETAKAVADGESYKCIRIATGIPEPYVLYRLKSNGFNHHRYFLTRKADGTVVASDIHILLSDERMSKTLERGWRMVAEAYIKPNSRTAPNDLVKFGSTMTDLSEFVRRGKNREAIEKYQTLPEKLQRDKNILLLRFRAAQALDDDDEYERAMADIRKYHPNDSALDLLLIDSHLLQKRYTEALQSIERVNQNTGGDPYLDVMRAGVLVKLRRFPDAHDALASALKAEPDLIDVSITGIDLAVAEKKFDEAVRLLKKVEAAGYRFENLGELPEFKEFAASPEYAEWEKTKKIEE